MDLIKGKSFFYHNNEQKQYPYLTENIDTEVLIVGGGVAGALALYQFVEKGYSCVLVDESRFGLRSTSITTALLQYELEDNYEDLLKIMPETDVKASYELGSLGLKEVKRIISELGNHCGFEINDTILLSNSARDKKALQKEYEYRRSMGYPVKFYDEANNPTPFQLKAAVFSDHGGARLNPCCFTFQLLESASRKNARLYENTKIKKLSYKGAKIIAAAQYGACITADKVIIASGYDKILGTKRKFCQKQLTYNIAVTPPEDMDDLKLLVRDNKKNYHYLRQLPNGKIIFGGGDTRLFKQGIRQNISHKKYYELLDYLNHSFLSEGGIISIDRAVSGVFGVTPDNLGVAGFDKDHPNLMYCLGYGANGILFAAIGAKLLAEECGGHKQELLMLLDPFRPALSGL